jgi:hypothetical protein
MQVGALGAAAYVIGPAGLAALENERQHLGMALDVEPVADVLAPS